MMLVRAPTLIFDRSLTVSVIATHRESVVSLNGDRADAQVDQHRDVDFKPGGAGHPDVRSVELYNPATGRWTATGRMTTARASHTATLLPNAEVLVAGGVSKGSSPWAPSCTSSAELYNPSTGQWTTTGGMTKPRATHTATLLDDGSVLVTGAFCKVGSRLSSTRTTPPSSTTHPRALGKPLAA